jgi:hypothetical protein
VSSSGTESLPEFHHFGVETVTVSHVNIMSHAPKK